MTGVITLKMYSNNQQIITILEETIKTYKYGICKVHVHFKIIQVIDFMYMFFIILPYSLAF